MVVGHLKLAPKILTDFLQASHKLHTAWEFWFYKRPFKEFNPRDRSRSRSKVKLYNPVEETKQKVDDLDYKDQLKPLGKIGSVEDFFNYFVFMKQVQEMPREIDLFFFRHGEVPMWEESPEGGIWITKCKKEDDVDRMWEAILLSLIGE